MSERQVVLDQPVLLDEQAEALRHATERAEKAEAEIAKLKSGAGKTRAAGEAVESSNADASAGSAVDGIAELRKDSMMAHLLDSLEEGKDIGHYGRLVFAMVARHFLPHEQVVAWMRKDQDVNEEKAQMMLKQVEGKDYSPPRRDKILDYQRQQDFPILPHPDDPDCGNLYRNLKFPDHVYEHIGHYQEQKMEAGS